MRSEPTVFVVDDDPASRDSVAALVVSKGLVTQCYASAEQFLENFDRSRYGCLVLDMRMTGMSGLELQEELLAQRIRIPVIIITGYGDVSAATSAMRNGAVTFLQKPCSEEELWESISTALERHRECQEVEARCDDLQAKFARLTPQEHEVMEELVAGTPNKVIAAKLEMGLRTVELRRANIMKKLETRSLAEVVRLNVEMERYSEVLV